VSRWLTPVTLLLTALLVLGVARAGVEDDGLIVYWSDDPFPSIWAMDADGSNAHRLLSNDQNAKRPRLSPDRQFVAFDGAPPGKTPLSDFDIQVVGADGTGLRTLTSTSMWDLDAQWLPNQQRVGFSRMPAGAIWRRSWIWTIGLDGSDAKRITPGTDGRWSPGGKKLVVSSPTRTSDGELFVVNANGTGRRQITHTKDLESAAAWSRDGRRILFTRFRNAFASSVYTMRPDGSHVRRLGPGIAAGWSPDGSKILYTLSSQVYVMNVDGRGRHRLSTVRAADPDWR
jgi:TolB protein